MAEEKKEVKPEVKKPTLNKEEIQILIQVLNQPRNQDLQTATKLIELSNKLSRMIG